jgi:hypothetical protein
MARIGAALRRRVIMAWPRLDEHLAPWCGPIEREFDRRTGDTFGFLLAFADLALHKQPADSDSVAEIVGPLLPSLREWRAVAGRDDELMLNHLATWQLEPWERRKMMIRQLIYWASDRADKPPDDQNEQIQRYGDLVQASRAGEALRRHGLAVVKLRSGPTPGVEYLAIAHRHAQLQRIFRGTKWQDSVWRQSATRVPGALAQHKVRFQETTEGAVLIPIAAMLGDAAAGSADWNTPVD